MTNWDDYRFLVAVAEGGSFSAAARHLRVSQPTVRRRLLDLERNLGIQLFDKTSDGTRLSEFGERICAQARRLADQAEYIELTARGAASEQESRRVRVTASEGISFAVLTPVIARIRRQQPNTAIDLIISNRSLDLLRREADIAVRVGDPGDDRLVGRRVGIVGFGLFGSEDYLADAPPLNDIGDLAQHHVIESTGEIAHLPQAVWLREAVRSSCPGYSANSLLNQMNALAHGLGLLAMPTYLAADMTNIRRVLTREFNIDLDAWLLTHSKAKERPETQTVADMLATEIRNRLGRIRSVH